jgi:hypothetical protein
MNYDIESSFAHDKKIMAAKVRPRSKNYNSGIHFNQGSQDTKDGEDGASLSLSQTISEA